MMIIIHENVKENIWYSKGCFQQAILTTCIVPFGFELCSLCLHYQINEK